MNSRDEPAYGSESSLADLCRAAREGDSRAFAELHRRLSGGLRRFFQSRGCDRLDVLDELVQRTWIGVWDSIREGRYDPSRSAITTFAFAVASNIWLQQLRPRQGASQLPEEESVRELSLLGIHDPAALMRSCELLDAVRSCVRARNTPYELDDVERRIVEALSRGEPERSVAIELDLAPSTINARKRSALQKLRMCLGRKGFRAISAEQDALEGE